MVPPNLQGPKASRGGGTTVGGAEGPWGAGGLGMGFCGSRPDFGEKKNVSHVFFREIPQFSTFFRKNDERGCNLILPKVSLK